MGQQLRFHLFHFLLANIDTSQHGGSALIFHHSSFTHHFHLPPSASLSDLIQDIFLPVYIEGIGSGLGVIKIEHYRNRSSCASQHQLAWRNGASGADCFRPKDASSHRVRVGVDNWSRVGNQDPRLAVWDSCNSRNHPHHTRRRNSLYRGRSSLEAHQLRPRDRRQTTAMERQWSSQSCLGNDANTSAAREETRKETTTGKETCRQNGRGHSRTFEAWISKGECCKKRFTWC
jgi:hypothetical protein